MGRQLGGEFKLLKGCIQSGQPTFSFRPALNWRLALATSLGSSTGCCAGPDCAGAVCAGTVCAALGREAGVCAGGLASEDGWPVCAVDGAIVAPFDGAAAVTGAAVCCPASVLVIASARKIPAKKRISVEIVCQPDEACRVGEPPVGNLSPRFGFAQRRLEHGGHRVCFVSSFVRELHTPSMVDLHSDSMHDYSESPVLNFTHVEGEDA